MAKEKKKSWLEVAFHDGDALTEWVVRFEGDYEKELLGAGADGFVRFDDVRWLDPVEARIRKLDQEPLGTGSTAYVARRSIVRVIPMRDDTTFWEKGKLPDDLADLLERSPEFIELDDEDDEDDEDES